MLSNHVIKQLQLSLDKRVREKKSLAPLVSQQVTLALSYNAPLKHLRIYSFFSSSLDISHESNVQEENQLQVKKRRVKFEKVAKSAKQQKRVQHTQRLVAFSLSLSPFHILSHYFTPILVLCLWVSTKLARSRSRPSPSFAWRLL